MSGSETLQAKKAARDAKRKKLQKMFDQQYRDVAQQQQQQPHQQAPAQESSSAEPTTVPAATSTNKTEKAPPAAYASYQHASVDIEAGEDTSAIGHVVLIQDNGSTINPGQVLREQAQSLIHVLDGSDDQLHLQRPPDALPWALLQRLQENRQTLGTILMIILLYWWL